MKEPATRTSFADHIRRLGTEVPVGADAVKPKLRGWFHAAMAPLVLAAAITLVWIAPNTAGKVSCVVFGISSFILFSVSGIYHRGNWSPLVSGALRLADHSNIFLIIAGTYTPLSVELLSPRTATLVLCIVWGGALAAIATRFFWTTAPRWFYVPIYLALGWVAIWFLPQFAQSGGMAVLWLTISGGIAYTVGAVIYATKWPNPSPRWFGFHEIFHLFTVAGFVCHCVAIYLAVLS